MLQSMQCAANPHKSSHTIHNSSYFVCIAAIAIVNSIYLNNIFDIFRSQYHFNYFWVELSAPEDIDEMELGFIAGGELS